MFPKRAKNKSLFSRKFQIQTNLFIRLIWKIPRKPFSQCFACRRTFNGSREKPPSKTIYRFLRSLISILWPVELDRQVTVGHVLKRCSLVNLVGVHERCLHIIVFMSTGFTCRFGDDIACVRSSSWLLGALFRLISFAASPCLWRRSSQTSDDKVLVTTLTYIFYYITSLWNNWLKLNSSWQLAEHWHKDR